MATNLGMIDWIEKIWDKIKQSPSRDLISRGPLDLPAFPWSGQPIAADECYLEIYLESLRLKYARRFATTFQGVVYAFANLAVEGQESADLAAVSTPNELAKLDGKSLDRVIVLSKKIMGPVAWRGGDLKVQIGLFSVETGNIVGDVLSLVTAISSQAGLSFVSQIEGFVPLITKGMDLIAGQRQQTELEVAIDRTFQPDKAATYAIINVDKSQETRAFTIDPTDMKILADGKPLEEAYCVFSIRASKQRTEWGDIPALKDKYRLIMDKIKANDMKGAGEALTAFKLETLTSPDLIPADAQALYAKAEARVKAAFPAGQISKAPTSIGDETLSDLKLYG
jgi:hypothetical protein